LYYDPGVIITAVEASPSNNVDKAGVSTPAKEYADKRANDVKKRFMKLCGLLFSSDKQGARGFVDPIYLTKEGEGAVDKQLNFIFGFVPIPRWSQETAHVAANDVFDAGEIEVAQKGKTATLVPKTFSHNTWNEQPEVYWMQVDGEWYVDIYTDRKHYHHPKTRVFKTDGRGDTAVAESPVK
jgi:hypothetical protein